jgi:hypothetical protein
MTDDINDRIAQLSKHSTTELLAAIFVLLQENTYEHETKMQALTKQIQEIQDDLNRGIKVRGTQLDYFVEPVNVRVVT